MRKLKVHPNFLGECAVQRQVSRRLELLIAEAADIVMRPPSLLEPVRSPVPVLEK